MSYNVIVGIVPHNCGEILTNAAKQAGANGGTIIMARGVSPNGLVQILGFGDSPKDIAYIVIDSDITQKVIDSIKKVTKNKKSKFGVLFSTKVGTFFKSGENSDIEFQTTIPEEKPMYKLINVIVNKGYAEDAMAAARKAGAGGGTIVGARGTAKEGDAKFFGVDIVTEKEMLMILVPAEKEETIVSAIKNVPCLSKAGSGVVFCSDANNFTILGKEN